MMFLPASVPTCLCLYCLCMPGLYENACVYIFVCVLGTCVNILHISESIGFTVTFVYALVCMHLCVYLGPCVYMWAGMCV